MIRLRRAGERGHANHGWLDSHHTFSFADYYDPRHMGFRSLRVMNEDRIAGGTGFGMHPHADMEIITVVLEGALRHKDSMGNEGVIRPGEIQYMSAGTGVRHSEFNDSATEPAHLYQIWVIPSARGLAPAYGQRDFSDIPTGMLVPIACGYGSSGAIPIRAEATLYVAVFAGNETVELPLATGRHAWVQVLRGEVSLNGEHRLVAGDGAALSEEALVTLTGSPESRVLVFDLA